MAHLVQVFSEAADEHRYWGWECLTAFCYRESVGFENVAAAEASADEHRRETS